jgi:hypothetical protein
MRFYLGTHMVNWLEQVDVPLFVSRRRLHQRKTLPQPIGPWALDSGAFTELSMNGRFTFSADEYIRDVRRFAAKMPGLQWVAPMDWMCEPFVLEKTGWNVETHQRLTVANFEYLRDELGPLVIPVLQGWTVDDYLRCAEMYGDLTDESVVGVGSVCRRHSTHEAGRIFRALDGLNLHGFGVKTDGLYTYGDCLVSADSMAWSARGRRAHLPGCTHKNEANCLRYALRWRDNLLERLGQQRMEVA